MKLQLSRIILIPLFLTGTTYAFPGRRFIGAMKNLVGQAFAGIRQHHRKKRRESEAARVPFVFVKTHKTGSTTVAAVLRSTATRRGYHCFIPPVGLASHVWSWDAPIYRRILEEDILTGGKFDCWSVHSTLTRDLITQAITPRPLIIISIREPFRDWPVPSSTTEGNMSASFEAWVNGSTWALGYNVTVKGWHKSIRDAMLYPNITALCKIDGSPQLGFNGMSSQLLPYFQNGQDAGCLRSLNLMLDAVRRGKVATVILEHFDLSLVLLHRRLRWFNTQQVPQEPEFDDTFRISDFEPASTLRRFHDMAYIKLNEGLRMHEKVPKVKLPAEKSLKQMNYVAMRIQTPVALNFAVSEATKLRVRLLGWRDDLLYENAVSYLESASRAVLEPTTGPMVKRIPDPEEETRYERAPLWGIQSERRGPKNDYTPSCQLMAKIGNDRDVAMKRLDEIFAGIQSSRSRTRAAAASRATEDEASDVDNDTYFFIDCYWNISRKEQHGKAVSLEMDLQALSDGRRDLLYACEKMKNKTALALRATRNESKAHVFMDEHREEDFDVAHGEEKREEALLATCKELSWDDKTWAQQRRLKRNETLISSNSTLEATLTAAALASLPLRMTCEIQHQTWLPAGKWQAVPCEAAHYESPHGIPNGGDAGVPEFPVALIPASLGDLDDGCQHSEFAPSRSEGVANMNLTRVVRRGGCSFTRKGAVAQALGFAALMIVDVQHAEAHVAISAQIQISSAWAEERNSSEVEANSATPESVSYKVSSKDLRDELVAGPADDAGQAALDAAVRTDAPPLLPPMISGREKSDFLDAILNVSIPVVMIGSLQPFPINNTARAEYPSVGDLISSFSGAIAVRVHLQRESVSAVRNLARSFGDLDIQVQRSLGENMKFGIPSPD
eukprot:CAMPEP_0171791616 /NCGR_PEP_ID=MMETSP0991-20121206/66448_1 /TAXON_ID=483369 /ORGANISM="non described non described, Strain CCMP2098" /LENGTH=898 /DNA_ID=CAMNT_0012401485 /DNA_START=24 /DNA_END=2721 /DNA_ORIENTATION=-